jgi:hypothetical protein
VCRPKKTLPTLGQLHPAALSLVLLPMAGSVLDLLGLYTGHSKVFFPQIRMQPFQASRLAIPLRFDVSAVHARTGPAILRSARRRQASCLHGHIKCLRVVFKRYSSSLLRDLSWRATSNGHGMSNDWTRTDEQLGLHEQGCMLMREAILIISLWSIFTSSSTYCSPCNNSSHKPQLLLLQRSTCCMQCLRSG